MYAHTDKESTASVATSTNIPGENGAFTLDDNTCNELETIIDHLLHKDETGGVYFEKKCPDVYENNEIKYKNEYYTDTSDEWTDESESEIEYPGWFLSSNQQQSGETDDHGTRVIDLPQFILVFTAFKAEDTLIVPPNDLLPEYLKLESEFPSEKSYNSKPSDGKAKNKEIIKKHKALINRKGPDNGKETKPKDKDTAPKQVRRIKYVRYSTPMDVVQREREIQATANERRTTEAAVQCDLENETGAETEDSTQLEWINHFIEAHVLNGDGYMYECHVCGEIALSYASKERHSLIHKDSSSLCFQCGLHFRTADMLKSHEKTVHGETEFEIKRAMRCPKLYCNKAFHSKKQLFKHIDGHAKKTEQRCSKCQRTFYSLFQYHMHKSKRNCWR